MSVTAGDVAFKLKESIRLAEETLQAARKVAHNAEANLRAQRLALELHEQTTDAGFAAEFASLHGLPEDGGGEADAAQTSAPGQQPPAEIAVAEDAPQQAADNAEAQTATDTQPEAKVKLPAAAEFWSKENRDEYLSLRASLMTPGKYVPSPGVYSIPLGKKVSQTFMNYQRHWNHRGMARLRSSLGAGEPACTKPVIPPDETMAQIKSLQQQWRDRCLEALRMPPGVRVVTCAKGELPAETMSRVKILQQRNRRPDVNLLGRVDTSKPQVEKPIPMEASERKRRMFRDVCKKWGKTIWHPAKDFLTVVIRLKELLAIFQ